MKIKSSKFYRMCDKVDEMTESGYKSSDNYYPLKKDIERINENNIEDFLPYLYYWNTDPLKLNNNEYKNTIQTVRNILKKNVQIAA